MKFKFVPYDGTRERMTAILSGAIDMGGLNVASGRKYLENGDLKGFAIAAAERSKHLPDMPTLKELGVDTMVEIGAGKVLSGLGRRIDADLGTMSVGTPETIEEFLNGL